MQTNHVIGVIASILTVFMVLLGVGIFFFARAMQRRSLRFQRSHELVESSTSGTRGIRSEFSTQGSSEERSQESQSSTSTQSHSIRTSSQRHERKHRTYKTGPEGLNRLPPIAEEWLDSGYQGVPEALQVMSQPAESLPKLEETPASHGCNQTCHGRSPKAGEPRVGLGIAQGRSHFA